MVEKRFSSLDTESGVAKGYAVRWNEPSFIGSIGRREKFRKGSLKIPEEGVGCFLQHRDDHILGNTKSNTLRLKSDDVGLFFELDVPSSREDVKESLRRKDIQGASIAFRARKQNYSEGIREIEDALLTEISLVSAPAHKSQVSYRNQKTRPKIKWSDLIWDY